MKIYNDHESQGMLEKLNALGSEYSQWHATKARKEHECEFGCKIKSDEIYYKKEYGAWHEVSKLCENCMDKVLFLTIGINRTIQDIAELLIEKKRCTLGEAVRVLDETIF